MNQLFRGWAVGLCLAFLPSLGFAESPPALTWSPAHLMPATVETLALVVYDEKGRAIFSIDTKKRAITVPDDVDVNAAARRVIEAMGPYLRQAGDAK